jgi:hypothetical protein
MGAVKITRVLIVSATITALPALSATPAGARPGHTSCQDLGALVASEARAGTIGEENSSLPRGSVDDLLHAVQVGGTYFGEPIPAFCQPK